MPRGPISAADAALLDTVRRRGAACSPYQLERWRTAGLLPRNIRSYPGAGSSASSSAPETADIAMVPVGAARRGRGPQELALSLFAAGLPVAGGLLVPAFVWAAGRWLADAAAAFAQLAADEVRALPPDVKLFHDLGDDADAIAARALVANGPSVRTMRRRLCAVQPGQPRYEREAVLPSACRKCRPCCCPGPNREAAMTRRRSAPSC